MVQSDKMYIISAPCWNCKVQMQIAIKTTFADKTIKIHGPESFSSEELILAKSHKVVIKLQNNPVTSEEYAANMCQTCGSFISRHFLFSYYFMPSQHGNYMYTIVDLS